MRLLMCRPTYYGVDYSINPWMEQTIKSDGVDHALAVTQWNNLRAMLEEHAIVDLIDPVKGLPDMVFTANAGSLAGKKRVIVSQFKHNQRIPEEAHFVEWFRYHGYEIIEPNQFGGEYAMAFEGDGDLIKDQMRKTLWLGYGQRSDIKAKDFLFNHRMFFRGVINSSKLTALQLIDPRFYHLDTCFCPLGRGHIIWYPPAFSEQSQQDIRRVTAPDYSFEVDEQDALSFACNAVNFGDVVICNTISDQLKSKLQRAGYRVKETPLSEFIKSGGSARCLSLQIA